MQINAVNAALGRKVRELREAHGWTQGQLADRFRAELSLKSLDPTTITRMERGSRPFVVHELAVLARIFGVETTDLLRSVGPLDDAVASAEARLGAFQEQARKARRDHHEALRFHARLQWLQTYRQSGDSGDLARGVAFLQTITELERRNDWRAILLDAGVPESAIREALRRAKVTDPFDADDAGMAAFVVTQKLRAVMNLPEEQDV